MLVGAGDIADCTGTGDEDTADLLETMPSAASSRSATTSTTTGCSSEFNTCYTPSWGRPAIKSRTRPTIGNHDYGNGCNDGGGYFDYFNGAGNFSGPAGDRDKGYYSYDVGDYWHVVVLNSECYFYHRRAAARRRRSPWLRTRPRRERLEERHRDVHRPRWSSGPSRPGIATLQPLWQTLYDYGAELLLAGHDHHYERFAPQNAGGQADPRIGVREIIVGTGGAEFSSLGTTAANSEVRNNVTNGVLKLRAAPVELRLAVPPCSGRHVHRLRHRCSPLGAGEHCADGDRLAQLERRRGRTTR